MICINVKSYVKIICVLCNKYSNKVYSFEIDYRLTSGYLLLLVLVDYVENLTRSRYQYKLRFLVDFVTERKSKNINYSFNPF